MDSSAHHFLVIQHGYGPHPAMQLAWQGSYQRHAHLKLLRLIVRRGTPTLVVHPHPFQCESCTPSFRWHGYGSESARRISIRHRDMRKPQLCLRRSRSAGDRPPPSRTHDHDGGEDRHRHQFRAMAVNHKNVPQQQGRLAPRGGLRRQASHVWYRTSGACGRV